MTVVIKKRGRLHGQESAADRSLERAGKRQDRRLT
jgi:hypothetical protein